MLLRTPVNLVPLLLLVEFLLLYSRPQSMRIGFANIRRGFVDKGADIEATIIENVFQIFGLCETDLLKHDHPPTIPGFQCILSKDPARRVAAYIQNDINFEVLNYSGDLPHSSHYCWFSI